MTIKEIANLAGVSISTVSKIINQKDSTINPKTRERVLQIVKEYNYTPYSSFQKSTSHKSFVLGILLRNASKSPSLVNGILETAQEHGYNIMLLDSRKDPSLELRHITTLCRSNVDGVIWEPVTASSCQHEYHFNNQEISVCYINEKTQDASFHIDYEKLGYALTQKLLDYKHSKIACILEKDCPYSSSIFQGFKKNLFDNQISLNYNMEIYYDDASSFQRIITSGITGIITARSSTAITFFEQMCALHYHVPTDLSIVSLKEDSQNLYPHITSVQIPYFEFGKYVCENLIAKCEKLSEDPKKHYFSLPAAFDTESSVEIPSFYRPKKILVVGSINTDHTFSVDQIPQIGKTTRINSINISLGGKGANQAVGVAKLGHEAALIGEIGHDTDSDFIIDILEKQKVDTRGIHRDTVLPTGKAYIYVEKSGEGTITIFSGANQNLTPESIQQKQHLFKKAGYCLLSSELHSETIMEACVIARQYHVKTILKPSAITNLTTKLASLVDIIVPNRKEASILCPDHMTIEEQAESLFQLGIPIVIITLGSDGCYLKTQEEAEYFSASNFVAVDTTGGADAFISALAVYLTEEYSLRQAIKIANYAAGFCVSRHGVVPALADSITLNSHIQRCEPSLLYPNTTISLT